MKKKGSQKMVEEVEEKRGEELEHQNKEGVKKWRCFTVESEEIEAG